MRGVTLLYHEVIFFRVLEVRREILLACRYRGLRDCSFALDEWTD